MKREPIPRDYATELVTVMNALNDMDQPALRWDCGTRGIGVVVSDTMMFQRAGPSPSDPHLSSFFGLALPLLERGMPVEPVQLEAATVPANLGRCKVLVMTYEGMKPMTRDASLAIAGWVKAGGSLVFIDDDRDPYNSVQGWWKQDGSQAYHSPREALFAMMGVALNIGAGSHSVGKGTLIFDVSSPAALAYRKEGASGSRELVRQACSAAALEDRETNHIVLRRGPYLVAAGLENATSEQPHELRGCFIDLFSPSLAVVTSVVLTPGRRVLLYDVDGIQRDSSRVLASACKIVDPSTTARGQLRFRAVGPDQTEAVIRIGLSRSAVHVTLDEQPLEPGSRNWDEASRTLRVRFPNRAAGRWVVIE